MNKTGQNPFPLRVSLLYRREINKKLQFDVIYVIEIHRGSRVTISVRFWRVNGSFQELQEHTHSKERKSPVQIRLL